MCVLNVKVISDRNKTDDISQHEVKKKIEIARLINNNGEEIKWKY